MADLPSQPLRLSLRDDSTKRHKTRKLKENRKGQWACDLDQPYRLIFEPHEDPIPTDKDGKYIWIEIKGVEIVEIEDYHDKKNKKGK